MTTREIYFKNLYHCGMPCGHIFYIREEESIMIIDGITVLFDEHEKNVAQMVEMENEVGFKCWVMSPEGEKMISKIKFEVSKTFGE